jgi:hypothetical protein
LVLSLTVDQGFGVLSGTVTGTLSQGAGGSNR